MTADANEPKIIPFGKHKGRSLEELLIDDPGYLQWLSGQDWFRAKFTILHQTIINRGAEPEETPDHNAMQVRFLDDEFCLRFFRRFMPDCDRLAREKLDAERERNLHLAAFLRHDETKLRELQNRFGSAINLEFIFGREFEDRGVDVVLHVTAQSEPHSLIEPPFPHMTSSRNAWNDVLWGQTLRVELKPVVGDDYPAVLRQMKANRSDVLFVGAYTGIGASEAQFIKTFATADKRVIFARDVG